MTRSDQRIALHTAARRYCMEHYDRWMQEYVRSGLSQEKAYHLFPRYLVLKAMRIEIERLRPGDASSEAALAHRIVEAAANAETPSTLNLKHNLNIAVATQAMDQERAAFADYIQSLRGEDLDAIEPLPFRRTLDTAEAEALWNRLEACWDMDWPWYPLKEGHRPGVLAFHTEYFDKHRKGGALMRSLLQHRGVARVFELREFDEPGCEIDISLFEPAYTLVEGCWTTPEADWLVYASHESSITIAGDWLVAALKQAWPDWRERQYGGPFSTGDLRGSWDG